MSSSTFERVPIGTGAAVGSVAWLAGVVLTHLIALSGISNVLSFYVAIDPILGTLGAYLSLHTWFLAGTGVGWMMVITLLPISLLLAGGFHAGTRDADVGGVLAGATVAIGYLSMTVLGIAITLVLSGPSTVDAGNLVVQLVVTGTVFPILVGGLGGLVADSV